MKKLLTFTLIISFGLAGVASARQGAVNRMIWDVGNNTTNTVAGALAHIQANPTPTSSDTLSTFQFSTRGDDYYTMTYGWLVPPMDGAYTFHISSDDGSALWLSSEALDPSELDPINAIASVTGWTNANEWDAPDTRETGGRQTSQAIQLEAGVPVYMVVVHTEDGGGDHMSVGWSGVVGASPAVIPSTNVWSGDPLKPHQPTPADGAVDVVVDPTLMWDTAMVEFTNQTVYLSTDPNLPDVLGQTMGGSMQVSDLEYSTQYYWRVDQTEPNDIGVFVRTGDVWTFQTRGPVPFITLDLPNYSFAWPGETLTLQVEYQSVDPIQSIVWYKDGAVISTGTSGSLAISDFDPAQDAGVYKAELTNVAGTTTTNETTLMAKEIVGYWPFDGDFEDKSANAHHATPVGAAEPSALFQAGMKGQAVHTGSSANDAGPYLSVGPVGISGAEPRSIAGWVKADRAAFGNWAGVFGFAGRTSGANDTHFDINRGSSNVFVIHVYGTQWTILSTDTNWHFLVASYDGETVRWFLDGYAAGSASRPNLNTEDYVQFGKRRNQTTIYPGLLDEILITNYPLDDQEVLELYATGLGQSICGEAPAQDLNGDCRVGVEDLLLLAGDWLSCGFYPLDACPQ